MRRPALRSASFSTLQQAVQLVSSAVIGVLLARLLSREDLGLYSVAMSLVAIGTSVASGGVATLSIRALLEEPAEQRQIISAVLLLRQSLALLAYVLIVAVAAQLPDADAAVPAAIAGLALFARGLECLEQWFQSEVRTVLPSLVRIAVILVTLGARVVAFLVGASLTAFLLLFVAEAVVATIALLITYLRTRGNPGLGRPDPVRAVRFLARSWPLLLANVARQVNLRADIVLISALAGSSAAGVYAVAARLSEITYFLPLVFTTASFPAMLEVRRRWGADSPRYRESVQRSYDRACWTGIAIAAVTFAAGPTLIELVYGSRWSEAGAVLQIHVLALPFVFMSAVLGKWIVAEGFLLRSLSRQVSGAVLNIVLNLVLIPEYGIRGAAVATVVSYSTSSYLFCFVGGRRLLGGGPLALAGRQMTLALVLPVRMAGRFVQARRRRDGPSTGRL